MRTLNGTLKLRVDEKAFGPAEEQILGKNRKRNHKGNYKKETTMEDRNEPVTNSTTIQTAIHQLYEGLENKEYFSVEEAACLVLKSPVAIRQAVRRGELKGLILDHHVICIPRESLLEWLQTRPRV